MNYFDRRMAMIEKIRKTILEAREKGLELDYKRFLQEIMAESRASRRTAREWLQTAKFQVENVVNA